MDILPGWKSILAAAGLTGLALYDASLGNYAGAWQSLMAAVAVFGIKMAVERNK
jgi:hypothetical protein